MLVDIEAAEAELAAGRYRRALGAYANLLRNRLATIDDHGEQFRVSDLLVVERLAELSTLFGLFAAANDLLDGMVELCERAGNYLGSDYARLKRTELALARGRPHDAYTLLRELKPRLGELEEIDLTRAGLVRWEREIGWQHYPAADRTVLLTRAYLVMGEVLASLGHYAEAIGVLERGGFHGEHAEAPDLARQSIEPLGLRRAAALLEYGDLDAAETVLKVSSDERRTIWRRPATPATWNWRGSSICCGGASVLPFEISRASSTSASVEAFSVPARPPG